MAILVQIEQVKPGESSTVIVSEKFESEAVSLGRGSANDIVLKAPDVSGSHAKVVRKNGSLFVIDLNSSNGTYLEDSPIDPGNEIPLLENSRIVIGSFIITATLLEEQQQEAAPAAAQAPAQEETPQDSPPAEQQSMTAGDAVDSEPPIEDVPTADVSKEDVPKDEIPAPSPAEEIPQAAESDVDSPTGEIELPTAAASGPEENDDALKLLLADESWSELIVKSFDKLSFNKGGGLEVAPFKFSSAEALQKAVKKVLAELKLPADCLLVDSTLANGVQVKAALPPLGASGPIAIFTRYKGDSIRIADLVTQGVISKEIAVAILDTLQAGKTVVISGEAGAGKTTLLSALLEEFRELSNVAVFQQKALLKPQDNVTLFTFGAESLTAEDCQTLCSVIRGVRPEVLLIDDCPSLFTQAITGVLHNDCGVAVCLESRDPKSLIADSQNPASVIARTSDLVVHIARFRDGSRAVTKVFSVEDQEDGVTHKEVFAFTPAQGGTAKGGAHSAL